MDKIFDQQGIFVGRGCGWHGKSRREKLDGFSKTSVPSSRDIDFVIAVVVRGWADVPAHGAMASKCAFALSLWFIDNGLSYKGCHGPLIEVEEAKHLVSGRMLGIDAGGTKEIDRDLGLREKLAPEAWGEFAVTA